MSTIPPARIRIAADLFQFDDFADALRSDLSGFIPKLRAGDDAQFEIALFDNGTLLTDLSGISSLQLEIKPLHAEPDPAFNQDDDEDYDLRGPAANVAPIRTKSLAAIDLNAALTLVQWESLAADQAHAIITLDANETNLAPGDRWLTLAVTTTDTPAQTRTIAAGRIRILGGGRSISEPVATPSETFYSASQSDARFLRQSENLADLADATDARDNLGLGSAAVLDFIDEGDFASQSSVHLPTQQSVKAYVDDESWLSPLRHAAIHWTLSASSATGQYGSGGPGTVSNVAGQARRVTTGATADSGVYARWGNTTAYTSASPIGVSSGRPFSKAGAMAFNVNLISSTADGSSYILFGAHVSDTDPRPLSSDSLVGFQIDNNVLYGIAVNTSAIDKVDLSMSLTVGITYRLVATWDGAGNIEFYSVAAGGAMTQLGTSSSGPNSGPTSNALMLGSYNGVDNAIQAVEIAAAVTIWR